MASLARMPVSFSQVVSKGATGASCNREGGAPGDAGYWDNPGTSLTYLPARPVNFTSLDHAGEQETKFEPYKMMKNSDSQTYSNRKAHSDEIALAQVKLKKNPKLRRMFWEVPQLVVQSSAPDSQRALALIKALSEYWVNYRSGRLPEPTLPDRPGAFEVRMSSAIPKACMPLGRGPARWADPMLPPRSARGLMPLFA
eukprot:6187554-Pleurochrysis_carterae.AAC.2